MFCSVWSHQKFCPLLKWEQSQISSLDHLLTNKLPSLYNYSFQHIFEEWNTRAYGTRSGIWKLESFSPSVQQILWLLASPWTSWCLPSSVYKLSHPRGAGEIHVLLSDCEIVWKEQLNAIITKYMKTLILEVSLLLYVQFTEKGVCSLFSLSIH